MEEQEKNAIEKYKREIILLIQSSSDFDYLVAVYTFANTYPDKSKGAG